jgi:hypothetical protein
MSVRRHEVILFFLCWFIFAYFNQGGGWNQNSRFGEIRAMAEEGRFAIDDFLVYQRAPGAEEIRRVPAKDAEYTMDGKRRRICWVDGTYQLYPVGDRPVDKGVEKVPMTETCASGDVSFVQKTGHFHPNKPPGTSFIALPAYTVIHQVEKMLGINPDHWWTMTLNVWLTTIFSVGLVSAVGCVLFYRLAREFAGGKEIPALLATVGMAFGTTFFPFGTILFDHALTAILLFASFYWLKLRSRPALAGACAGLAVVTNYVAAGAVVALGIYALCAGSSGVRTWKWRRAIVFSLGGLPFAGLLMYYNWSCFGSPLQLSTNFQNPLFKDDGGFLGMFGEPKLYVAQLLLVSPYRGILCLSPVLIMGLYGWFVWLRDRRFVAEARLGIAIFGFFFLINSSFNGYHAGYSAGPRYLVPGLPFLALPLVVGFLRWRKTTIALLAVSLAQHFLLVVTDAQNALAVGGHARIDDAHRKDDFFCSIVYEYALPLFAEGQVKPLLRQMIDIKMEDEDVRLSSEEPNQNARRKRLADERAQLEGEVAAGDAHPFLLAAVRGPVSVNPVAVYDGLLGYGLFPINSKQAQWASCNAGEFLFPNSRWSVLPLFVLAIGGFTLIARRAVHLDGTDPDAKETLVEARL